MPELGRREYYPWFADSTARTPKDRYLNTDFLKAEQRRIEESKVWDEKFRAADRDQKLDEYITYVIPVELSTILERRVNERGYNILGTSALRNNLQFPKLALFPKGMELPPDYSLIRIFEPRKEIVGANGDFQHAVVVDDYGELADEQIYVDLPSKDKKVLDTLKDYLGGDELMAQSLYSPMISSPPTVSETGGIGSFSLNPPTRFADTLNEEMAKLLPPEYTSYGPPQRDVRGFNERTASGRGSKTVYQTAENIATSRSQVGFANGRSYSKIDAQVRKRMESSGEYSFVGNIVPSGSRKLDVVQNSLDNFTQNEITISSYDELQEADVDLTRLNDQVTDYEDIWINLVDARQINPSIDRQTIDRDGWVTKLEKDWGVFLPEMGYDDELNQLSEFRAEETYENLLRLAQKIARSEKRRHVTDSDIETARRSFTDQAERLLNSDLVKDAASEISHSHTSTRESLVRTMLRREPSTLSNLIAELLETGHFDREMKAKRFVRRMRDEGYIFEKTDGRLGAV